MDGKSSDANLEKEFANSTSLHGIARVANDTRIRVKLAWLSIMMVCLCVCAYQVQDRFSDYLMYTANTAVSVEYVSNLDFPAVTICNFNRYRQSQVSEEEYKYVKYILATADYEFEAASEQASPDFVPNENSSLNFNFTEFTRKAGFSIYKSLIDCQWRGKQCYAENFTHVFTPFGNCWTFNSGVDAPVLQTHQAGEGNGLYIVIDIDQEDYTETIKSNLQAGLKVVIHNQHTPPFVESGLAIPPGVHAFVGVRRQQYLNLEKPHGKCDASRKPKRYKNYTLEGCTIECQLGKIEQICHCNPVGFPGNKTECSPFQERNCSSKVIVKLHSGELKGCECTVPCNHTAFQTTLSSAVIPNQKSAGVMIEMVLAALNQSLLNNTATNATLKKELTGVAEKYIKDNLIILSVYYEELNFQRYQQTKAYTLSALVSDIGGQLGLFLGASFITLAEIISYIVHKVKRCFATIRESESPATEPDNSKIEGVTNSAF